MPRSTLILLLALIAVPALLDAHMICEAVRVYMGQTNVERAQSDMRLAYNVQFQSIGAGRPFTSWPSFLFGIGCQSAASIAYWFCCYDTADGCHFICLPIYRGKVCNMICSWPSAAGAPTTVSARFEGGNQRADTVVGAPERGPSRPQQWTDDRWLSI